MKKNFYLLFLIKSTFVFSQVGINTKNPESTLDVNGNAIIRKIDSPINKPEYVLTPDDNGLIRKYPFPTGISPDIKTYDYSSSNGAQFSAHDRAYTVIPGTTQNIKIPKGGKVMFINFALGIDYINPIATGSGYAYYSARLFIDNIETDVFQTVQEPGPGGTQNQYSFSTIKGLPEGDHIIDVRLIRSFNNGTSSGSRMTCLPISVYFNAAYLQ